MRRIPSVLNAVLSFCVIRVCFASYKKIEEEEFEIGFAQSLGLQTPPIVSFESEYQFIEIYHSDHFGKVFILDECLQLTERDAPHYNEMLSHVPVMEYMASVWKRNATPKPLSVLVVGGGDGYVVSELLKHSFVASVDHVELDKGVTDVSKEHFPWAKNVWDNEKVDLIHEDGASFVQQKIAEGSSYDIVIQDSSDPFFFDENGDKQVLPSSVLYTEEYFKALHQLLQPNHGVLMFQAETYNIPSNLEEIKKWRSVLMNIGFENARYGTIAIPTYSTGQIGFYVAHATASQVKTTCMDNESSHEKESTCTESNQSGEADLSIITKYFDEMLAKTLYYHPKIHRR